MPSTQASKTGCAQRLACAPCERLVLPGIPCTGDGRDAVVCLNEGDVSVPVGGHVDRAESETADEGEVALFRWRLHELLEAGYAGADALALLAVSEADLCLATELPRRGCPPATAVRILL